ncbi:MazG-like family protein [Amphibacillus jilinensis]
MLCSDLELDLETIIKAKLEKNNQKYPIDKAKGSKKKYSDLS